MTRPDLATSNLTSTPGEFVPGSHLDVPVPEETDMKPTGFVRTVLALLSLILVPVLLASCGLAPSRQSSSEPGVYPGGGGVVAQDSQAEAPAGGLPEQAPDGGSIDRLVIRTKTLRLLVRSTTEAVEEVRGLAKTHSGIVQNMQVATDTQEWLYRYDERGYPASDGAALRGWVTVRVPAAELDAFVEAVALLGTVVFQSESSDDVTQEHVDLTARLANLRAQEARLRELVAAASNVEEMLAVERELWRVRGEIESLDAQVQYLERQAAMASVTVELTEDKPVVRPDGGSWGFVQAITDGIRGAAGVLTFLISFLIAITPLVLLGLLVFYLVRGIVRRRQARHLSASAAASRPGAPRPAGGPEPGGPAVDRKPVGETATKQEPPAPASGQAQDPAK